MTATCIRCRLDHQLPYGKRVADSACRKCGGSLSGPGSAAVKALKCNVARCTTIRPCPRHQHSPAYEMRPGPSDNR